jgi:hypothetical protein
MKEFKNNFNLFSESSLVDLDWSNVVAAGSSVVTSLLPVMVSYPTHNGKTAFSNHARCAAMLKTEAGPRSLDLRPVAAV